MAAPKEAKVPPTITISQVSWDRIENRRMSINIRVDKAWVTCFAIMIIKIIIIDIISNNEIGRK